LIGARDRRFFAWPGRDVRHPEGLAPSRLGGTDFFPAPAALGKAPGAKFAFGDRAPDFIKLGGVFCPATEAREPSAPGAPVPCPLLTT
jgi:hypothetical protein